MKPYRWRKRAQAEQAERNRARVERMYGTLGGCLQFWAYAILFGVLAGCLLDPGAWPLWIFIVACIALWKVWEWAGLEPKKKKEGPCENCGGNIWPVLVYAQRSGKIGKICQHCGHEQGTPVA